MGSENVFEMFLNGISSFKGVAVDRDQFLYSTFKKYSQEDIQSIISLGPPQAGVEKEEIDKIADKIIRKSKWSTTGVSFLTGMPGDLQWRQLYLPIYYNFTFRHLSCFKNLCFYMVSGMMISLIQ